MIPSLTWLDGTVATNSSEKAQLLASLFVGKMKTDNLGQSPLHLEHQCDETIPKVKVTQVLVERML